MALPKSVKIGKRNYRIDRANLRGSVIGKCAPAEARIVVATDSTYVFWHEITHAILHDMGEAWRDEKFVVAFSKRLDQAIRTARF